jgi:hypothetical protein
VETPCSELGVSEDPVGVNFWHPERVRREQPSGDLKCGGLGHRVLAGPRSDRAGVGKPDGADAQPHRPHLRTDGGACGQEDPIGLWLTGRWTCSMVTALKYAHLVAAGGDVTG